MGKTYLYSYESIIVHGLPERSLAMAGLRLASKVEISRVSHSDHLVQVNHPGHRNPPTHNILHLKMLRSSLQAGKTSDKKT